MSKMGNNCDSTMITRPLASIRKGVDIIEKGGEKYILKKPVVGKSIPSKLRGRFLGSASIEYEYQFNRHLLGLAYHDFRFPKLVLPGPPAVMMFEYVEGRHHVELSPAQAKGLAKCLVDFQLNTPWIQPSLYSAAARIFRTNKGRFEKAKARRATEHTGDATLAQEATRIANSLERRVQSLRRPAVEHRDLNIGNVIFRGDAPYIIDFSGVARCKKWIWNDAVWFSLPPDQFYINAELLRAYARELNELGELTSGDMRRRLHYSLVLRVIFLLCYVDMSKAGSGYLSFFHDVLSSEERFGTWVDETLPPL